MKISIQTKILSIIIAIGVFSYLTSQLELPIIVALVLISAISTALGFWVSSRLSKRIVSLNQALPATEVENLQAGDELDQLANHLKKLMTDTQLAMNKLQETVNLQERQKQILSQTSQACLTRDKELSLSTQELFDFKLSLEKDYKELATIITGITDGVIAVDLNRKILFFNTAAQDISGYSLIDSIGKPIDQMIKLFGTDQIQLAVQNYFPISSDPDEDLTFVQKNIKIVGKEDKVSYINAVSKSIVSAGAVNVGSVMTFRDVTKEQDLEKMKLDFVSMAAHELRTPLTTVQGYLSFLQNPAVLDKLADQEKDFLSRAFQSATRLNKLIENLLEVTRIEQGRLSVKAQQTELEPIIKRITEDFMPVATQKDLKLFYKEPATKLPLVMVDPIRIEEVISNLISNAVKYTEKGEIKVFMEAADSTVITSVGDTGGGISEEGLSQLFTKFYRVENNITAGAKGTGLGLYLCKNIIESHGGRIWVESVVGKGSVFSFSVPIA